MQKQDPIKKVSTAVELEAALQLSYTHNGVCVLDVYSGEWGPCKAIEDTFRRISLEAPEGVNIRFYQVNATQVLSSLKNPPPEAGRHQRPKNTDAIKDTLPEAWTDTLEQQEARAKPLFVFFKEGRRVDRIDGCNTPLIRATAKDLCTVKIPANQVITNSRMLEFWEDKFPPDESEVAFDKFCKGLQEFLELPNVAFQDAEKNALMEAAGVKKEVRMVTGDGLQHWIGEEDNGKTVADVFKEVLPDFEARAKAVLAERAAEEARQKEEAERRAAELKSQKGQRGVAAQQIQNQWRHRDAQKKVDRRRELKEQGLLVEDEKPAGSGKKILIAGPPAGGKGTQCEAIVEKFGVVHISTGDLLRAEVKKGSPEGKEADECMKNGALVPDALIIKMVKNRLAEADVKRNGWLLDGFPRTAAQAEALKAADIVPEVMVLLQVPDSVVIERVEGRRNDPVTGKVYHMVFNPPPEDDAVRGRLEQRKDDTREAMVSRLETYHKNVDAILAFYTDVLVRVSGNRGKHDVTKDVLGAVDGTFKGEPPAPKEEPKKEAPPAEEKKEEAAKPATPRGARRPAQPVMPWEQGNDVARGIAEEAAVTLKRPDVVTAQDLFVDTAAEVEADAEKLVAALTRWVWKELGDVILAPPGDTPKSFDVPDDLKALDVRAWSFDDWKAKAAAAGFPVEGMKKAKRTVDTETQQEVISEEPDGGDVTFSEFLHGIVVDKDGKPFEKFGGNSDPTDTWVNGQTMALATAIAKFRRDYEAANPK